MGVIAVLIIILGFFIFSSISDSNVDYYVDDIGGYTFNIPDFLVLDSTHDLDNVFVKSYSSGNLFLSIMVYKDPDFSEEYLLDMYNAKNSTKVNFGNLKVYRYEIYDTVNYFFKIDNDLVYIHFWGAKNTDILVKGILKDIQ